MTDPDPLRPLWPAVRRHLWQQRTARALRQALAAGTLALGLALAVHLLFTPLPGGPIALALALLVLGWVAQASLRRPGPEVLAHWADRHLGGQSAFATWHDLQRTGAAGADPRAARHLAQWAAARVAPALAQLAAWPSAWRLQRPGFAMAITAAAAGLAWPLADPDPGAVPAAASAARPTATAPASRSGDRGAEGGERGIDLARALQAQRTTGPGATAAQGSPAAALPADPTSGPADAPAPADGSATAGQRPAQAAGPTVSELPRDRTLAATTAAGAGSGRGVGDQADAQRDERRRAPGLQDPAASAAAGVAPGPAASAPQRRADAAESGTYDDSPARLVRPAVGVRPLPATPPPGNATTALTESEANYTQAWLKAIARGR